MPSTVTIAGMSLGGSWRGTARARWSGARAGVLVVPVLAMLGASVHAAPPVGPPVHPQPIIDGSVVPECAWPSVVALRGDDAGDCSGFYIGGRVVLTAAHCMVPGFRVKPIDGKDECETDADCPELDAFGEPLTLECPSVGADHCRDPDPTKSNDIPSALFGERYLDSGADGHIRRSVEIAYCRRHPEYTDAGPDGDPNDFAYCILRQAPNVQPIPIAMHCEVEQFLAEGTPVTAVGFGWGSDQMGAHESGIKRSSTSVLPLPLGAGEVTFHISQGWSPGSPTEGDSGGPLFVALPDGTWRAIGVAITTFVEYVPPWRHVGWMLTDPNVVQVEILPCHTPQGEWAPSAGCGGFPMSPGSPSGSWGRGPRACFDPEVGGLSQTCGPPGGGDSGAADETGAATMGVVADDDGGPGKKQEPAVRESGCACRARTAGSGKLPWVALLLVMMHGSGRRRRWSGARWLAFVAATAALTACPGDDQSPGPGGGTADGGGTGLPPGPPPIDPNNPDYQGILGGIDPDPSVDYHDLAVGNVSRSVSSSECCQDYVIASPSTSVVRVLFSADLPGVTFLADLPDELVDVGGPGVDDVLLADVDGDERNDLVALRTDGNVAVVRGVAGPPGGPFFDPASLAVFPAGAAAGAMAAGDLDCDGDLDLAVTAPTVNGIVPLFGNGNGTFVASTPTPAGNGPQDLALGDVDGDDEPDIAVSNDDGSFSIVLNGCGNFSPAESYEIYPTTTPDMPIALGRLCPGHPDAMAVAVGIFDTVFLTCGDGTGGFSDVVEPHGVQVASPHDYAWDPSPGDVTESRITDLFIWEAGSTLYSLRAQSANTSEIVWLPPNPTQLTDFSGGRVVADLRGGVLYSESIAHPSTQGQMSWNRVAFIGSAGAGVTK